MNRIFKVYHEDYMGNEPKEFNAYDKDDAARQYAEYYNEHCENILTSEDAIEIFVAGENSVKTPYKISAELSIRYYAEEVVR